MRKLIIIPTYNERENIEAMIDIFKAGVLRKRVGSVDDIRHFFRYVHIYASSSVIRKG